MIDAALAVSRPRIVAAEILNMAFPPSSDGQILGQTTIRMVGPQTLYGVRVVHTGVEVMKVDPTAAGDLVLSDWPDEFAQDPDSTLARTLVMSGSAH